MPHMLHFSKLQGNLVDQIVVLISIYFEYGRYIP